MPAAAVIPAITSIGGSLLGGLGAGGKQRQVLSTNTQAGTQTVDQTQTPLEDQQFADFRKSLYGPFAQYLQKAGEPVYGDAQKAQFLNDQNSIYNTALRGLRSSSALGGRLRSGAFDAGATNLAMNRAGNTASFFGQIPLLNQQAYMNNMGQALGLGTNWAGRAPVGMATKGTNISNIFSNGSQTEMGPGFGNTFSQLLGGGLLSGRFDNMFSGIFGGNSNNKGFGNGVL